ncbi:hypothetical protein [Metabacillus fastidiosus]|uniref:hypothetical protein n=1 Tax=Metabacillus fastidiosus TaxID=1458 RepID=UPI002DB6A3E5|nr:hypothetical protein [Metabacillus fastidiosus]MEC2076305.1 hypothetical protein [Metabacillus fastidiosus]
MAAVILFVVIAVVIILGLVMMNMNSVSSKRKVEDISAANNENQPKEDSEKTSADLSKEDKTEENQEEIKALNMGDQAYRKALQSFRVKTSDDVKEVDRNMKDDDFRKALKSMVGKNDR